MTSDIYKTEKMIKIAFIRGIKPNDKEDVIICKRKRKHSP